MGAFDNLNEDNFQLYAAKAYEKPSVVLSEFEEDLQRILYIKRLLTKYCKTGVLKERLLLNHLIVIFNVFGLEAANRMLFFKLEEKDLEVIKPFLIFLSYLPKKVLGINGKDFFTDDIGLDAGTVEVLRGIK
jgi:hypothetical protein